MALSIVATLAILSMSVRIQTEAQSSSEYQRYVHEYLNSEVLGNWTYVEKPIFPIIFDNSQILVGQNWSIVCPLLANHSYHVYCYGEWISNSSDLRTDYDIYVYDPAGTIEGLHTASAGQLEHLGTSFEEPLFAPKYSGNYTFVIVNDPKESRGAQQATFMIIEDAECNVWHQQYIEGKDNSDNPVLNTSWAYEFTTESQQIEIYVKVPETLDMYEARLYLMSDPKSKNETILDGIPLAWEPGLYGNKSKTNTLVGGYNLESEGYRGVAYASCDHAGQEMFLNFTSPYSGKSVYHLVLIGEEGGGEVQFLVKTTFDACLQASNVPGNVYMDSDAVVAYVSKSTDLLNATLQYSTNSWKNATTVEMEIVNNRTCRAIIPGQPPETFVSYRVEAVDLLDNTLLASGNYSVRSSSESYIEKPMLPVLINESQIEIGKDWSITCPLVANRSYHAYFYGDWINNGTEPVTDYDIYVYNCLGELENYHTESAGLPEHIANTPEEAFFVPKCTGNYTFIIVNDPKESRGAQQATFMIIEDAECNVWHQQYIEGKDNSDNPVLNTSWAYELTTENQQIEIYIKVPETLDMYETRLYLMSSSQSENRTALNGVPLAWEPGLYGNKSKTNGPVGGYNLDSKQYRGVAYASCEFEGEDMFINYSSSDLGTSLYHLVFIGESGSGVIDFLVKTEFNTTSLKPSIVPDRVHPDNNATIAYTLNSSELKSATLQYSTDNWKSFNSTDMQILENATCRAAIPKQVAGTVVYYMVEAKDILENVLIANGSYSVKYPSTLNISLTHSETQTGDNVTILGRLTPQVDSMPVTIYISSANETKEIVSYTLEDGTFSASFQPEALGTWIAYARFNGDETIYESASSTLTIEVVEHPLSKYSFYIFGGIGAVIAVGIIIYVRKSRV